MPEADTAQIKYVYLDIVGYTVDRSVDAQSDIITALNKIVTYSLEAHKVEEKQRILIPTGDGICIALIDLLRPFDIHLRIAREILIQLDTHNAGLTDEMREFEVRIGLNENVDNLITDINGKQNVAGRGINMAARIMNNGDAGHILVSDQVFTTLQAREQYLASFRPYAFRTKHGEDFRLYQYLEENVSWLNLKVPKRLASLSSVAPKLTGPNAYFFAYAVIHRKSIVNGLREDPRNAPALTVLLCLLAVDYFGRIGRQSSEWLTIVWGREEKKTFEEQLEHYKESDWPLLKMFYDNFVQAELRKFEACFVLDDSRRYFCLLNKRGFEKLRADCPEIWDKFELGKIPLPSD
jgi:class 3 adenylate cyclase